MHITTDNFPPNLKNDKAVIMMNHRTRLDWLYYWSVILRQGKLENEKIILKHGLKHIPGAGMLIQCLVDTIVVFNKSSMPFAKYYVYYKCLGLSILGWAMQMAMFIFIKRHWEEDEKYLCQILRYFTDTNYPLQVLIFPEGTDYDTHSVIKSKSYALKNNLPIYKHVLHPRIKGVTYCIEQLRTHHGIDAIYDVTVGYRGNLCQSELDLAMGNFPQDVYFHIKRHPIETIPDSTKGLEKWCTDKWAEKEETLDQFYKDGKFAPEQEQKSMVLEESRIRYQMIFWIVYWLAFLCIVSILLYEFWWIRLYTVIVGIILVLQSVYGGGFEMLQVKRHSFTKNILFSYTHSEHNMQNGSGKKHKA